MPRTTNNQRGAVFIEFLFLIPIIVLIWTLMVFIYAAKKTAVVTQKEARECAWEHAMSGCESPLPTGCSKAGDFEVSDKRFGRRTLGTFSLLSLAVPGTKANFRSLHGRGMDVHTEEPVQRPSVLGGETIAEGTFSVLCADDPPRKWTTDEIFKIVCKTHGNPLWCN